MADTKISALSAETAAPGDEIPVNRGGVNYKITAGDILKQDSGTLTANAPALDLTQTWNNSGVTFTGLRFDYTNTASAAGSVMLDLKKGGTSIFSVGITNLGGTWYDRTLINTTQYTYLKRSQVGGFFAIGNPNGNGCSITDNAILLVSGGYFGFANDATNAVGGTVDLSLYRDAANTLAQRNGTNAQTFRLYRTISGSDYGYTAAKQDATAGYILDSVNSGVTLEPTNLLDLQLNGASKFKVDKDSNLRFPSNVRFYRSTSAMFFIGNARVTTVATASFSWTSNAIDAGSVEDLQLFRDDAGKLAQRNGANAQESRVYGSYTSATNFQRTSVKTVRETSGALSGASYTTTIAIPAYANLIGVTTRVTTDITGATTYDVGDGSDVDLWGAAIGITAGTASATADFTATGAVGAAGASRTITLTANGSNFTGGEVEICAHYLFTEAD